MIPLKMLIVVVCMTLVGCVCVRLDTQPGFVAIAKKRWKVQKIGFDWFESEWNRARRHYKCRNERKTLIKYIECRTFCAECIVTNRTTSVTWTYTIHAHNVVSMYVWIFDSPKTKISIQTKAEVNSRHVLNTLTFICLCLTLVQWLNAQYVCLSFWLLRSFHSVLSCSQTYTQTHNHDAETPRPSQPPLFI